MCGFSPILWAAAAVVIMARMRKFGLALITLLVVAAGAAWWLRGPLASAYRRVTGGVAAERAVFTPDPGTYATLAAELTRWRRELAARHRRSRSADERAAVEHDARVLLEQTLPVMMRCWLGTPYDFNGTAAKPGGGKIACGYFVATVLLDAGFRLDRYRLAKQPSENILHTFLARDACTLGVDQPYETFRTAMEYAEPGIYLAGLDTHVAFIIKESGGGFRFIHASGSVPYCVVDESPAEAKVLRRSRWRMLGNLTASPALLRRWLLEEKIRIKDA